mmetsp:Transcript_27819/g.81643  ORF Transcript_27819/g.81643 Transcript_27819/m.81643 type:complete len:102 (-) Transcript_27819:247-552(-)
MLADDDDGWFGECCDLLEYNSRWRPKQRRRRVVGRRVHLSILPQRGVNDDGTSYNNWTETAKLVPRDAGERDHLGRSVAIIDDDNVVPSYEGGGGRESSLD